MTASPVPPRMISLCLHCLRGLVHDMGHLGWYCYTCGSRAPGVRYVLDTPNVGPIPCEEDAHNGKARAR